MNQNDDGEATVPQPAAAHEATVEPVNPPLRKVMQMRVTVTLIALNVLAFLFTNGLSDTPRDPNLIEAGAMYGPAVAEGQWWRIVTGAFLHENILHISTNMIALLQVGSIVETMLGPWRMLTAYLFSMLTSALAIYIFTFAEPSIGASGAIFGLFGTLVAIGLRLGADGRRLVWQVVPIIAINLGIGFVIPHISNAAHLGGLAGGFVVGLILLYMGRLRAVPASTKARTGS